MLLPLWLMLLLLLRRLRLRVTVLICWSRHGVGLGRVSCFIEQDDELTGEPGTPAKGVVGGDVGIGAIDDTAGSRKMTGIL